MYVLSLLCMLTNLVKLKPSNEGRLRLFTTFYAFNLPYLYTNMNSKDSVYIRLALSTKVYEGLIAKVPNITVTDIMIKILS